MIRRLALASIIALAMQLLVQLPGSSSSAGSGRPRAPAAQRPNIVFVLTDDLAWNLVTARFMPHVVQLERNGTTFTRYIVSDSLCCPSRATIFTGLFPHDTGVFTNVGHDGGYYAFTHHKPNLETRTFAVATRRAGYLNSMMGKYLNRYGEPAMTTYVPPGWSDWHVAGNAYSEFNYDLNENGTVVHYGGPPPAGSASNYLTDVLATRARTFIDRAATAGKPFLLEVATFAPHYPYTPAPRNASDFSHQRTPRDSSFNTLNVNPPDWLGLPRKLTAREVAQIDGEFRMRAQAVEAVDRLVAGIESELASRGLARNTYIVFSSDNGYHMGQHRLLPGKQTAFDSDIRVPLIIDGPGVPRNRAISDVVQNTDLYPTFVQLAGGKPARTDGRSLLPLLHPSGSGAPVKWRTVALIEHHGPTESGDPDAENGERGGNPSPYEAIRIFNKQYGSAVYVEYRRTAKREYYNLVTDRFERVNSYPRLSPRIKAQLHRLLLGLERCHNTGSCWAAGDPAAVG